MLNFQFKYKEALRKAKDYYPNYEFLDKLFPELKIENLQEKNFFETLAVALRKLWPEGEKDGKFPWRDSVPNLTKRLKLLWDIRSLKEYTLDECLTVARMYVSQYEHNTKYMKTLKYFILRQNEKLMGAEGKVYYTNNSTFADMLEKGEYAIEKTVDEHLLFEGGELV